jgi:hypothetical protein
VVFLIPNETTFLIKKALSTRQSSPTCYIASSYDSSSWMVRWRVDSKIPLAISICVPNPFLLTIAILRPLSKNKTKQARMKRRTNERDQIKVNDEEIPLTQFPAEIITQTYLGMLQSLRGEEDYQGVEITINSTQKGCFHYIQQFRQSLN